MPKPPIKTKTSPPRTSKSTGKKTAPPSPTLPRKSAAPPPSPRKSPASALTAPARRLRDFTESVIREQTRLAHLHGAVNLAQGFPDFPCDPALKEFARAAVDADFNQYSITWGMASLRQAIAKKVGAYNGIQAVPDRNVTVTCGATEAMI